MQSPRSLVICRQMEDQFKTVATFKGSSFSRVLVVYFFDDLNDTIRSKLNDLAKENVSHCILVEVFQRTPPTDDNLLKTYLHPAVRHFRGPRTGPLGQIGPVLAFYDERGSVVNFLKNFIFHAFKVGI